MIKYLVSGMISLDAVKSTVELNIKRQHGFLS